MHNAYLCLKGLKRARLGLVTAELFKDVINHEANEQMALLVIQCTNGWVSLFPSYRNVE